MWHHQLQKKSQGSLFSVKATSHIKIMEDKTLLYIRKCSVRFPNIFIKIYIYILYFTSCFIRFISKDKQLKEKFVTFMLSWIVLNFIYCPTTQLMSHYGWSLPIVHERPKKWCFILITHLKSSEGSQCSSCLQKSTTIHNQCLQHV